MMVGDSMPTGEMGMEGDTSQADSALVNQEGAAQPDQQTMESDSTMVGSEPSVEDAVPTDSAQGQSPDGKIVE